MTSIASTPQGQRLLVEHRLDRRPCGDGIELVLRDQVLAVGRDRLYVLQHLEPLEAIVVVKPHAVADDFQHVHNAERIVALVRAQLAMVGMVDRDQRVDAGALGGVELVFLQLATIGRKRAEIVAQELRLFQKRP